MRSFFVITLSVEEFNELVKLIPKAQDSIAQYKLQDTGPSPAPPPHELPPPLIDLEKILSDLDPKEKLKIYHQDLAADKYLYGPTIDTEMQVIEHGNPVSLPSLENIDDGSQNKTKREKEMFKRKPQNVNKK